MIVTGRRLTRELHRILETESVHTIYQPVVPIAAGARPIGYEALTRGPGPHLLNPVTLFEVASQRALAAPLDQLCCRHAVENFPDDDGADLLIFINLLPESIESGVVDAEKLSQWVANRSLTPSRVVLEVTEKKIGDPTRFYRQVSQMRSAGFRFAVDDIGTGYSNLALLSDLVPEFFKLDLDFVRLTRVRPVRQLMVEALVRFAGQIGAMVVAEGIESPADAEVFRLLGVQLGQGFLYRPA
ncbi:MAG: diguanylate phosphodiesterase [Sulfobacillus acidophilus]|uniref:Diguanylate phosphodiesterase n=1 Tax=Sulfobacillus acidophilus TaxID=53633 RepID=A0A2T2WFF1_9FIRM|nr:MAG: diguanylate phosphodiesterase [Sulfobacillus acidophilus]